MFTQNEWRYLIQQRPHANKLHAHAKIPQEYDYIYGIIVLPDDGDTTLIYKEIDYNDPEAYLNYDPSVPTYTLAEWRQLEAKGWSVVIVWECELAKAKFDGTVERVSAEIIANGDIFRRHRVERRAQREERSKVLKAAKQRQQALMEEIGFKPR